MCACHVALGGKPMLNISSIEAATTINENTIAGQLNAFLNKSLLHLGLESKDVGRKSLHRYAFNYCG